MLPINILVSLLSVAVADQILGVHPDKQALYSADQHGKWHCLSDPSIELSFSQINDDFCDCPDGSDEPGTNACAFTQDAPRYFYCQNVGYHGAYIENYKLNDGVCDYDTCCDGSDEYKSGACPNVCDQVKSQFEDYLAARKSAVQSALKMKKALEEKAHKTKQQVLKSAESVAGEIAEDEARLQALRTELEAQTTKNTGGKAQAGSAIDTLVAEHSRKLKDAFSQWQGHVQQAQEKIRQLEAVLEHLLENYNPNFNDQAVKQAVAAFGDYISNKAEESEPVFDVSGFTMDGIVAEVHNSIGPQKVLTDSTAGSRVGSIFDAIFGRFFKAHALFGKGDPVEVPSYDSDQAQKLISQITELEKKIHQKRSEEAIYRDDYATDYGENDIYRAVKGQWVNNKIGEYNYRLGFLDSLYQDNTLVGRFYGIHGNSMYFAHGSKCWNGPQRSAQVDMKCGERHHLVSVGEPEKCQYRFVMTSPLVCGDVTEEEIAREFKVDRARLEI